MGQPTTIRKFNPGLFQSDAKVKKDFVVRRELFKDVMEVVQRNVEASSCEHVLLVGARGQGKTMLLARVKAELCSRRSLARQLLPVWFMEESYEIWDPADFWLEAMAYIANAIDDESRAGEVRALRRQIAESDAAPRTIAKEAREAALEVADGRKLVLMVENLQPLCEAVAGRGRMRRAGIGWLRETLAPCREQVMVLATATSLFDGLGRRKTFFKTMDLPPLNADECDTLLKSLGQKRRDAKALEILTGGNPRALAIVSSFAHEASVDQLADDLVSLIDEHTDYFRNYLENLARGERRVFVALADLWRPATTKEISTRARMDLRSVSALLGKLADRGEVGKEKGQDGKVRYFATMRLVSIYHKLRRGRDKDVVVPNLFRFMAVYYSDAATKLFDGSLSETGLGDDAYHEISAIIAGAMNEAASKKDAKGRLADSEDVLRRFSNDDQGPDVQLELAKAGTGKGYAHAEMGNRKEALEAWSDVVAKHSASDDPEIQGQVAWTLLGTAEIYRAEGANPQRAAESYDEVLRLLEETTEPVLRLICGRTLLLKGAHELDSGATDDAKGSFEQACRILLDIESDVGERLAWYAIVCLTALQPNVKADYAQQVYRPVVGKLRQDSPTTAAFVVEAEQPPSHTTWYSRWLRANLLLTLGEHGAALETFRQAYVLYDPKDTKMIGQLIAFADQIAAAGSDSLSERLRKVLESDKGKAEQIQPLVRALAADAGDAGKGPLYSAEVVAVANDLRERFKRGRGDRAAWLAAVADTPRLVGNFVVKGLDDAERWWESTRREGNADRTASNGPTTESTERP